MIESPKRKKPKKETLLRLYAGCRNECSFPGCSERILNSETGNLIGEICHISPFDKNHFRFREELTNEERREYNNLIALCGTHHNIVDSSKEEQGYTIEYLKEIKKQHESGLSNDVVQYINTAPRFRFNRKAIRVLGFIGVPIFLITLLKSIIYPDHTANLINVIWMLVGFISIVPMSIFFFGISKSEGYIFWGLFGNTTKEKDLIIYSKFANCIYCSGGNVSLKKEKIDEVDKMIGTCHTCSSKYTYEKNNIGRQLPYNIIKVNITQKNNGGIL